MSESIYGYCPTCGACGKKRERRPNGNDTCENGHVYPSRLAVADVDDDDYTAGLTSLASQLRRGGVKKNAGTAAFLLRCRDEMQRLHDQTKQLNEEQDAMHNDILDVYADLAAVTKENANLRVQLATYREAKSTPSSTINRLLSEIERLREREKRLIGENNRLRIKCGRDEMLEGDYCTLIQMEQEIEQLSKLRGYCETLISSNYGSQEHGAAIDAIGEWIENAREI